MKTMELTTKYLWSFTRLFAHILMIFIISIAVYNHLNRIKDADNSGIVQLDTEVVSTYKFDEFRFSTQDSALCLFKMSVDLNDENINSYIKENIPFIREGIANIVMNYKVDDLKKSYLNKILHKEISHWLKTNIISKMKTKWLWMRYRKKEYAVLNIHIYDFIDTKY